MSQSYDEELNPKYYMVEFYKKWHRYGFISIRYWPFAEKVQLEIAKTTADKKVESLSKCYLNTYEFMSYLHAEVHGNLDIIYPDFDNNEFKSYGGGPDKEHSDQLVSRIFTAGYWKPSKDAPADRTKRGFRAACFIGHHGANNSIVPDYNQQISFDMIQIRMNELAEIYLGLNTIVQAYALQRADQVVIFDD